MIELFPRVYAKPAFRPADVLTLKARGGCRTASVAEASGDGTVYEHFDEPVNLSPFSARRRPLFESRSRWLIEMLRRVSPQTGGSQAATMDATVREVMTATKAHSNCASEKRP